jgi:drug/metabolite transporter (DMT)-like permease
MNGKIALVLAGILTGLVGTIVKLIDGNIPVFSLVFSRFFLGTLFFLIVMSFIDKRFYAITKKDIKDYALIGLILACSTALTIFALSLSDISQVVLIASTQMVFVAILAFIFLKEKLKTVHRVSIFVAIVGLIILNPLGNKLHILGNILALASAFVYSIFLVYTRYEEKKHNISSIFWIFMFATLFLSPFVFKFGLGNYSTFLPHILILGLVCSGVAYLFFTYGIKRTKAETAAILCLISHNVSSIFFAVIFVGEILNYNTIIGGILLLSSGVYLIYSKRIKHFLHHH